MRYAFLLVFIVGCSQGTPKPSSAPPASPKTYKAQRGIGMTWDNLPPKEEGMVEIQVTEGVAQDFTVIEKESTIDFFFEKDGDENYSIIWYIWLDSKKPLQYSSIEDKSYLGQRLRVIVPQGTHKVFFEHEWEPNHGNWN